MPDRSSALNNQTGKKGLISSVFSSAGTAASSAFRWFGHLTQGAGRAANFVGNIPLLKNPLVRRLAGVLRLDWLTGVSQNVDVEKAQITVNELKQQYPNESPSQIAHRLMVRKSLQAGRTGFLTSLLPGFATAMLALDLAATAALQTELVYEIAAAYGLDLQDPSRRGEVLAIFGLAMGGSNAVKAGLGFLRNVPFAGAMIGASTNATVLYSLGYAASRFYEAKLREEADEPTTETLKAIQQQSEQYLNVAMAQQAIMDQILVHMILASYPEKTWNDIVPELKKMQLEPNSLNAIAAHLQSPQPLGALVQQLNCDFAIPLLAQCRRIAESSGEISPQEAEVIEAVEEKCDAQILAQV